MRTTIKAGLIIAAAGCLIPAYANRVIFVYDGDTLTVEGGVRVRLAGIDAPEVAQPLGISSKSYLQDLVEGKDVKLDCTDKSYGREVCAVTADGVDVQGLMVLSGWAFDSTKYSQARYKPEEGMAQKYRLGVWQLKDGGMRPWDYRKRRP